MFSDSPSLCPPAGKHLRPTGEGGGSVVENKQELFRGVPHLLLAQPNCYLQTFIASKWKPIFTLAQS